MRLWKMRGIWSKEKTKNNWNCSHELLMISLNIPKDFKKKIKKSDSYCSCGFINFCCCNLCLSRSTHVIFDLVKKPSVLVKNDPNKLNGLENLPFSSIFSPFWGIFNASGTQIGFKIGSHRAKWPLECGDQLTLSLILPKEH